MSKPTHTAYVVTQPEPGSNKNPVWHPVAAIWPHKNGNGFDVVFHEGISAHGRVTCTEPKEKAEE